MYVYGALSVRENVPSRAMFFTHIFIILLFYAELFYIIVKRAFWQSVCSRYPLWLHLKPPLFP